MTLRLGNWGTSLLAVAAILVVACSDDKESGPPSYVGSTDSALITVAAGGKLAVGAVAVEIPQGAVDSDKEISVKVASKKNKPQEKEIAIDVYEFGPDTQFAMPVKITFDLKGVSLSNKKADVVYLSQEDTDKWVPLADSKVKDGKITATTTHFSEYTVLLTPTGTAGGGGTGGYCETGFEACGGDVLGTWSYTSACSIGFDAPDGGVLYPCEDPGVYESRLEISGTITFNSDGTYLVNRTLTPVVNLTVPLACLAELSQQLGQPYTCDTIGGTIDGDNCVQGTGDGTPITEESDGAYTISGNHVTFTDIDPALADAGVYGDGGLDPNQLSEFCVSGDSLRLRYAESTMPQGLLTESTAMRVAQ